MKKKASDVQAPEETVEETKARLDGPKGIPTPKRKDQEAARQRPLVGGTVSKDQERNRRAEAQRQIRIGMQTGDERYLMPRDKGPQKRYARAFIDARTSLGEVLLFVVLLFLVISFAMTAVMTPQMQSIIVLVMWAFLALVIVDAFWATRQLKRRLVEKFGGAERGVLWYSAMRALQFRKMRQPKPQVARGQYPE